MRYNSTPRLRAGLVLATGVLVALAQPVSADHRDGYRHSHHDNHRVERKHDRRADREWKAERRAERRVERKMDRRAERKIDRKLDRKIDRKLDRRLARHGDRHSYRHSRGYHDRPVYRTPRHHARFRHVPHADNYAWAAVRARPNRAEPMPFHRWQRFMANSGYAPRALKPKRYRKYVRAFYRAREHREREYYAYRR